MQLNSGDAILGSYQRGSLVPIPFTSQCNLMSFGEYHSSHIVLLTTNRGNNTNLLKNMLTCNAEIRLVSSSGLLPYCTGEHNHPQSSMCWTNALRSQVIYSFIKFKKLASQITSVFTTVTLVSLADGRNLVLLSDYFNDLIA